MDFFEHQRQSHSKTKLLIVLFTVAVILTTVSLYLAIGLVFELLEYNQTRELSFYWWQPYVMIIFGAVIVAMILGCTLYKIYTLKGGGRVVAKMLGAKNINPHSSKELNEKKLYNIVEEMAIASGIPVPGVFVMNEENGINALAAGHEPGDAIVAVTQGSLDSFTRDEMQGVVAHEFSHILNGDMRLNLYLIGVLHGIVAIGSVGRFMMRSLRSRRRSYSRSRSDSKGAAYVFLTGLVIFVVGSVGVFFGKIIKSAICRQREYLADASAVQFTRNPLGISNVLKKIGSRERLSYIYSKNSEICGHMFIADSIVRSWFSAFATHPPVAKRIKRIEPGWDGKYISIDRKKIKAQQIEEAKKKQEKKTALNAAHQSALEKAKFTALTASTIVKDVGTIKSENIQQAERFLKDMPKELEKNLRTPHGACAAVCLMLFQKDKPILEKQAQIIEQKLPDKSKELFKTLIPYAEKIKPHQRIPIIDMSLTALHELSLDEYNRFKSILHDLMQADQKIDLFEYCLYQIVVRHLEPHFKKTSRSPIRYYTVNVVRTEVSELLSHLSILGHNDFNEASQAFENAVQVFGKKTKIQFMPAEDFKLEKIDKALKRLKEAGPQLKKLIVTACANCIMYDKKITAEEYELLRAVCDNMGCPMPALSLSKGLH